jgi:hypothetical protein
MSRNTTLREYIVLIIKQKPLPLKKREREKEEKKNLLCFH